MVKPEKFIPKAVEKISQEIKDGRAIIALSGGVDSSVCAELAYRAIGDRLQPIYIDTGLMRKGETDRIKHIFSHMNLDIVYAKDKFLAALKSITHPEEKRKAIGETFIRVFEEDARKSAAYYLIQR